LTERQLLGIPGVPDEVELNRMRAEYPLIPYFEIYVQPIIDGDTRLAQWWQVMRKMLAG
jgi:hypothetical protein